MKTAVIWQDGMEFNGRTDNHVVAMDAKSPIGKGKAPTPKELVALGLGGCTAMDVIALLKKYRQLPKTFRVDVDVEASVGGNPVVFEKAVLNFIVDGEVEKEKLLEAVRLSQSKYCGVSAMLAEALPIDYLVTLNGQEIGKGSADFETFKKESV